MKVSELIERLKSLKLEFGDCDIAIDSHGNRFDLQEPIYECDHSGFEDHMIIIETK
jgi:hypothetical protein